MDGRTERPSHRDAWWHIHKKKKKEMKKKEEEEEEQSQKRYMVSGSPCPLTSFLDVSFSVSFVARGGGPVGDDDHRECRLAPFSLLDVGERAALPAGRASEPEGRDSE